MNSNLNVLKFGGTSVKDAEAISNLASILSQKSGKILVVVSAMATITNTLVEIIEALGAKDLDKAKKLVEYIRRKHKEVCKDLKISNQTDDYIDIQSVNLEKYIEATDILGEISPKTKDMILSAGEFLSSFVLNQYLNSINIKSERVEPTHLIKTNSCFTEAEVDYEKTKVACSKNALPLFEKSNIIVTGGFIGSDENGKTTTLGRGGSDYSAAVIASALNAESLEIWTDVDGVMTSDPRIVENACLVKRLTYREAAELAYFGAKVLHPKTIAPAVKHNIPVYVKNTFNPQNEGTLIVSRGSGSDFIKAIAFRRGITVINIDSNRMLGAVGFLSEVFDVFKKHETSVDLITTSEVSISLTIDENTKLPEIIRDLSVFADVDIAKNKAIISVIGEGLKRTAGIAAKFFSSLEKINITMISLGASEVNLSIVVGEENLIEAVERLHQQFFTEIKHPEIFEHRG